MIPVLGVPILNGPQYLKRLLESVDFPIKRVVIVDNGGVVNGLDRPGFNVIRPGHNLGVAASWNLIIKSTPTADWWLLVNHDLVFGPGDLQRLYGEMAPGRPGLYKMLGLAAFAVNQATVEKVGLFDENFHPAYCEDIDYQHRADLLGVPHVEVGYSGEHTGSATIRSDDHLMRENGRTYSQNVAYYERKWGGKMHGGETFSTPFNQGGDVRDVPVDISRLRTLAWSRSGGS